MDQKNRMRKSRYEKKGTPYKIVNNEVLRTDGKYIETGIGKFTVKEIEDTIENNELVQGMSDYYNNMPTWGNQFPKSFKEALARISQLDTVEADSIIRKLKLGEGWTNNNSYIHRVIHDFFRALEQIGYIK